MLRCPTFIDKLIITSVFACPIPRTGTVEVVIEDEFAEENKVAIRWTLKLTHGKECEKNLERLAFQFVSDYSTVAFSMTRLLFMPTFSKILVINFTSQSNAAITCRVQSERLLFLSSSFR